jgi:hypothetical protein
MGFDIGMKDQPDLEPAAEPEPEMTEADNLSTFEGSGCNHTMEGESCPVHGLAECGMYESEQTNEDSLDPMDRRDGVWDSFYETKNSDPLDRIKNLALAKTR